MCIDDIEKQFGRLALRSTIHFPIHTVDNILKWGPSFVFSGYLGENLNWFIGGKKN